jgi:gas vesicle protein GvpK
MRTGAITRSARGTRQRTARGVPRAAPSRSVAAVAERDLASLRRELERRLASRAVPRWNANPEDARRSVAKLVLSLVEFLRRVMERQAIRRMEAHTLTPAETEAVGLALMRLEKTVRELARRFRLRPEDLNLDLGPLGRLM